MLIKNVTRADLDLYVGGVIESVTVDAIAATTKSIPGEQPPPAEIAQRLDPSPRNESPPASRSGGED